MLLRRTLTVPILVGTAFTSVLVMLLRAAFAPRITLYATDGCPPNYCYPTYALLPLVPLVLGGLLGLVILRPAGARARARAAAWGATLGAIAFFVQALSDVAAIPFHDPYFTAPYKAYALLYVAAVSAVIAGAATRWLAAPSPSAKAGAAVVLVACTLVGALVGSLARRELAVSAALAAGVLLGSIGGYWSMRRALPRVTTRRLLFGIVILAFVARAFFGLQTLARTGPGMAFAIASDDGDSYFTLASKVAAGPSGAIDALAAIAFPPGYSLFVGALLAASRGTLAVVVLAQAALAGLACFLVFLLGSWLGGRRIGLVAALLYAIDQNLIQNQSTLTAEALLLPLVLVALVALVRYRTTQRPAWLVSAAAAIGLAFVTRNIVALPLAAAVVVWLVLWCRPWRRLATAVAALALSIFIASAPVAIATAIREGAPRFTNQLAAVSWEFEGAEGMTVGNGRLLAKGIRPFTDPGGSLQRALADPFGIIAFYAEAAPQRLSTLMFFPNQGYSDPVLIVNPATHANDFAEAVTLVRVVALVIGTIGAVFVWRARRDPDLILLGVFALLYLAAIALLFPPYHPFRYRIPIEPLRYLAEAAGLIVLAGAARLLWSREPALA